MTERVLSQGIGSHDCKESEIWFYAQTFGGTFFMTEKGRNREQVEAALSEITA
jgi:hypothetical protein